MTGAVPPTAAMTDLVLGLADQLRWGIDLAPVDLGRADRVVVVGMGGSGMAGARGGPARRRRPGAGPPPPGLRAPRLGGRHRRHGGGDHVLGQHRRDPLRARGSARRRAPVAVVSAGGEAAAVAARADAPVVVVPGGLQPRAALGYQVAATAVVLHAAGAVPDPAPHLSAAAAVVDRMLDGGAGPGWALGVDLGEAMVGRIPVIVGGNGPAAVAAGRWATQFHENAKRTAFAVTIPEMNHNLFEALAGSVPEPGSLGVVGLLDPAGSAANDRRIRLTLDRLGPKVARSGEVVAQGEGVLERVAGLIAVGDVASTTLAERLGVDPVAVDALEGFKRSL